MMFLKVKYFHQRPVSLYASGHTSCGFAHKLAIRPHKLSMKLWLRLNPRIG